VRGLPYQVTKWVDRHAKRPLTSGFVLVPKPWISSALSLLTIMLR
jgi:hypothetical protein